MTQHGDNSDKMLKRFAEQFRALMDQTAEIQEEVKNLRQEVKAHGLNPKVIAQLARELRMDEDARTKQLEFEWEVSAGRKSVGLRSEIDGAKQEAA